MSKKIKAMAWFLWSHHCKGQFQPLSLSVREFVLHWYVNQQYFSTLIAINAEEIIFSFETTLSCLYLSSNQLCYTYKVTESTIKFLKIKTKIAGLHKMHNFNKSLPSRSFLNGVLSYFQALLVTLKNGTSLKVLTYSKLLYPI